MRLKFIAILFLMLIAACGQLPRPFQPVADTPPNPLVEKGVVDGLWIAPLEGTTQPMADLLSKSVIQELARYDIIASAGEKGPSNFILKGKTRINENDATVPYVILIDWTLYDRNGVKDRDFTQGIEGSRWEWDYGSPEVISDVGKGVAKHLATVVGLTRKIKQAKVNPVKANLKGIWIETTTGAPGDGAKSLTRAIRYRLIAQGVTVARDRSTAKYTLSSQVKLTKPFKKKQTVEIIWRVTGSGGKHIGQAVQKNSVPAGIFGAKWGSMAGLVATAAVGGIVNIINLGESRQAGLLPGLKPIGLQLPDTSSGGTLPTPNQQPNSAVKQ